jgi:N-terminal domain of reverse transcriptase
MDWSTVERNVRRLQVRIAQATKEGRWGKVRALQRLLTRSFSGKALAVRRVTENQGKKTPGVDREIWDTPEKKMRAVHELQGRGYQPQPLRRVYIPKSDGKTMRPLGLGTGSLPAKCATNRGSHLRYGYSQPALLPSADMSRLEATRIPTILPTKPTSRNAKGTICRTRFGAPVFFAFSGLNNAASALCAIPKSLASLGGACTTAYPASWVVRAVLRTAFCFTQSAMTGFIDWVFLFPNRVSVRRRSEVLEPDDRKLSRPVLRGPGPRNGVRLLGLRPSR